MHAHDTRANGCAPRARCRRWRTCPACAAIRQARIADAAERLAHIAQAIDWTTLRPLSPGAAGLMQARDEWLATARPVGAIWTVEQAPTTGNFHCNILAPSADPVPLAKSSAFVIQRVDTVRRIAAYISKREQMPDKVTYPGRIYGTAGPLWSYLASGKQEPVIAAAAMQHEISRANGDPPLAPLPPHVPDIGPDPEPDYRAIAARRLPDLLPAVALRRPL